MIKGLLHIVLFALSLVACAMLFAGTYMTFHVDLDSAIQEGTASLFYPPAAITPNDAKDGVAPVFFVPCKDYSRKAVEEKEFLSQEYESAITTICESTQVGPSILFYGAFFFFLLSSSTCLVINLTNPCREGPYYRFTWLGCLATAVLFSSVAFYIYLTSQNAQRLVPCDRDDLSPIAETIVDSLQLVCIDYPDLPGTVRRYGVAILLTVAGSFLAILLTGLQWISTYYNLDTKHVPNSAIPLQYEA